jgi:hypothetical protein
VRGFLPQSGRLHGAGPGWTLYKKLASPPVIIQTPPMEKRKQRNPNQHPFVILPHFDPLQSALLVGPVAVATLIDSCLLRWLDKVPVPQLIIDSLHRASIRCEVRITKCPDSLVADPL